ncbi:hypothetical protein NECAME_14633 [Necator americanus]|uniref:Uncharacterized protein n=1 Tax=Necator americanus TaxID=51031 RepID=W2SP31_NECAM|nr:hypothetical protein NECAME_14633 [Necator americanus]ETN70636.1 hypothetical protein NECAME_14633 [Necator americanus]
MGGYLSNKFLFRWHHCHHALDCGPTLPVLITSIARNKKLGHFGLRLIRYVRWRGNLKRLEET